jgi:HSP20 family protein
VAELPGLDPEHLHLEVLDDTVTIRGEIEEPEPPEGSRWLLRERRPGKFARTIVLPTEVNGAAADATIDNGLLTLRLPKAEAARPRTIKVTGGSGAQRQGRKTVSAPAGTTEARSTQSEKSR